MRAPATTPSTVLRLDAAPEDADPFDEATIRLANPAYDLFMNRRKSRRWRLPPAACRRVKPRTETWCSTNGSKRRRAFLTAPQWKACAAPPKNLEGREVYGGLDLSEITGSYRAGSDRARSGRWDMERQADLLAAGGRIGGEGQGRSRPLRSVGEAGHLLTAPGASISYEYVARYLWDEVFAKHRVIKIGFDRWSFRHFKPWLLAAGFPEAVIKDTFVEFGQGTQSMSPALRELESLILDRKLRHGGHPVLTWNAANTVTEGPDAANRKLSKRRSSGRIDGLVALAMAVGIIAMPAGRIDVTALIG